MLKSEGRVDCSTYRATPLRHLFLYRPAMVSPVLSFASSDAVDSRSARILHLRHSTHHVERHRYDKPGSSSRPTRITYGHIAA